MRKLLINIIFLLLFPVLAYAQVPTAGVPIGVPLGSGFTEVSKEDGTGKCWGYAIKFTDAPTDNADGTCSVPSGGAETNSLETLTTGIAVNEVLTGTAADTGVYKLLPDCNVAGSALAYEDSTQTWSCRSGFGGGLSNVVEDTTPQLGGSLDVNGQFIGDGTDELLTFVEETSPVNHIQVSNSVTGDGPKLSAVGDDTNIDLHIEAKGEGTIRIEDVVPSTATQVFVGVEMDSDTSAQVSTSEFRYMQFETAGSPSGSVFGITTLGKIGPIQQLVDTPATPSQTEFAGRKTGGGSTWADGIDGVEIFAVNNDEIYFGSSTQFDDVEVVFGTEATKNIVPTFWYNTAADTWTQFFPSDGTDGFQNTEGHITWLLSGISGSWTSNGDPGAGDTTAGYWIKIIRTGNPNPGTVTPTTIKIGLETHYFWDDTGILTILGITIGSAAILEAELEILDGATPTTTEFNYVSGVTSAIQTQLGTKATVSSGFLQGVTLTKSGTLFDPNAAQALDTQFLLWAGVPADLTITKLTVTCDASGNEIAGDIKWADAFIGFANATVIETFDTTSGVRVDAAIAAGTVAAGKDIYGQFDSQPNAAITQCGFSLDYDFD